jgi:hypothetical protein
MGRRDPAREEQAMRRAISQEFALEDDAPMVVAVSITTLVMLAILIFSMTT